MIVTAGLMRRTVLALLQANLPAALPGIAAQESVELPNIRTWNRLADFALIAESQSPACIVTTPGIVGFEDQGMGRLPVVDWAVRVFVVAAGRTFEETADRVGGYTAAVRSVLLAEQGLTGICSAVRWVDEKYTELPARADGTSTPRTVGAGSVLVTYPGVQTDVQP